MPNANCLVRRSDLGITRRMDRKVPNINISYSFHIRTYRREHRQHGGTTPAGVPRILSNGFVGDAPSSHRLSMTVSKAQKRKGGVSASLGLSGSGFFWPEWYHRDHLELDEVAFSSTPSSRCPNREPSPNAIARSLCGRRRCTWRISTCFRPSSAFAGCTGIAADE